MSMNGKYKLIIICLLLTACTGDVVIPESYNLPDTATHALEIVFEINKIGNEFYFKEPFNVYPLSKGSILVQNANSSDIYEINQRGKVLNKIGSKGRGPGQFQNITRLVVLPNDEIHVFDRSLGRQSVYIKNNDDWQFLDSYDFKNELSELTTKIPNQIVDTLHDGFVAVFKVSPSSSTIDTLTKVYAYTAKVDKKIQHQEEPRNYLPVSDIVKSEWNGTVMYNLNPRLYKAFYLYSKEKNKIVYVENTHNHIYEFQDSEKNIIGYLPFEKFSVNTEELDESLNNLSTFYPFVVNEIKKKMLKHEPLYGHVKLINNRLWLNIARSDSTKPNFISTTLSGKVTKSFFTKEEMEVVQVSDTLIISKVIKKGVSHIVGYKLTKL